SRCRYCRCRNPMHELRNPQQTRIPKSETSDVRFEFGNADLLRISLFGLRISPRALVAAFQLSLDIARDQLDREQIADAADLRVLFEAGEIGEGHARAQLGEPFGGDLAVLDEFRIALED